MAIGIVQELQNDFRVCGGALSRIDGGEESGATGEIALHGNITCDGRGLQVDGDRGAIVEEVDLIFIDVALQQRRPGQK